MKYPTLLGAAGASLILLGASPLRAQSPTPAAPDAAAAASATPVSAAPSVTPMKAHERAVSPKMLEKYDANKNGVLDPEEKAAMKRDRQARHAEDLKKYDKNGDGKLDESERAARKADRKANKAQ